MPDYHQIRRLGAGAFGEVWLVEDRAFGEVRAVKFVPQNNIHNPTNFYEEPQTLKALQHENVVRVSDAGRLADGRLYIAMEYIASGSIEDAFGGGVVPLRSAIKYTIDICKGLTYTHDRGYVHRDIKPANVLLDDTGSVKISDFGLCTNKLALGGASAAGYIMHIAPEVILDDVFTFQSDIYAVGMTAYRLLNGDSFLPVFNGSDELKDLIVTGNYPDRSRYQPFVPRKLLQVINKAMSPDPNSRFATPRDFRHALERVSYPYDWYERIIPNGSCWVASDDNGPRYHVQLTSEKRSHELIVRKIARTGRQTQVHSASLSTSSVVEIRRHQKLVFDRLNSGKL